MVESKVCVPSSCEDAIEVAGAILCSKYNFFLTAGDRCPDVVESITIDGGNEDEN